MTIIKSKPYFRFIIIALLFLTYWVFSNGAEKLVYLTDIDVVSSLGKANVQAALDAKGITVSRITRLIVRSGIVG